MAGKMINESKEARRCDHNAKRTKSIPAIHHPANKIPIKVQGADGHMYVMLIDSDLFTKPPNPSTADFTAIAAISDSAIPSDSMPTTASLTQIEELEYSGWISVEETQTTIN